MARVQCFAILTNDPRAVCWAGGILEGKVILNITAPLPVRGKRHFIITNIIIVIALIIITISIKLICWLIRRSYFELSGIFKPSFYRCIICQLHLWQQLSRLLLHLLEHPISRTIDYSCLFSGLDLLSCCVLNIGKGRWNLCAWYDYRNQQT